jgi:transcriptional regulator with XRE-family HTH domain
MPNYQQRKGTDVKNMTVGQRIYDRRTGGGLGINDLAARLGVGRTTVAHWEDDDMTPSPKMREKLAATIGGTPSDYA